MTTSRTLARMTRQYRHSVEAPSRSTCVNPNEDWDGDGVEGRSYGARPSTPVRLRVWSTALHCWHAKQVLCDRACSRTAMRLPHAKLSEVVVDESSVDRLVDVARSPSSPGELRSDAVVGSAEHLRSVFDRAGPAIDRALGRWLDR